MAKEKTQKEKFREAARELDADTDEETFDRALRQIAPVKNADAEKGGKPPKD